MFEDVLLLELPFALSEFGEYNKSRVMVSPDFNISCDLSLDLLES